MLNLKFLYFLLILKFEFIICKINIKMLIFKIVKNSKNDSKLNEKIPLIAIIEKPANFAAEKIKWLKA